MWGYLLLLDVPPAVYNEVFGYAKLVGGPTVVEHTVDIREQ